MNRRSFFSRMLAGAAFVAARAWAPGAVDAIKVADVEPVSPAVFGWGEDQFCIYPKGTYAGLSPLARKQLEELAALSPKQRRLFAEVFNHNSMP